MYHARDTLYVSEQIKEFMEGMSYVDKENAQGVG